MDDTCGVREESLNFGRMVVARTVHPPGWRWSTHVRPVVGTPTCQARHVGYVLAGRMRLVLAGGAEVELAPGTVFDVPPGHDGWVIGEEPAIWLEWTGAREWLRPVHAERALATLLFTDIVDSTVLANRLGDRSWRARLEAHDEAVRQVLRETRGTEVKTTGDGFLARFDGPAQALEAAVRIRDRVRALPLEVRQGVHVGEVELRGEDVAGLTVHEAARIASLAGPGEIYASAMTRALASGTRFSFQSLGARTLKGFAAPVEVLELGET